MSEAEADADADADVPILRRDVEAIGGAAKLRAAVPTAAARHAGVAPIRPLGVGNYARFPALFVIFSAAIPVFAPLPHITAHIVNTQLVRLLLPDGLCLAPAVSLKPTNIFKPVATCEGKQIRASHLLPAVLLRNDYPVHLGKISLARLILEFLLHVNQDVNQKNKGLRFST